MLRTDFSNIEDTQQAHKDDHLQLHRLYNTSVFAEDYASIQDALDDAASRKIPIVYLRPDKIYDVATTIAIPNNVTLHGGGIGFSSPYGATLRATTALNPMISLGSYSSILGCHINCNYLATVGVLIQKQHQTIQSNWIENGNADGIAIKAGAALYPIIKNNQISAWSGYGLDALNAYSQNPLSTYYGINHGKSEGNVYNARLGLRVEGMLTSIHDDFEPIVDSVAVFVAGDTIQSQITMIAPYFELTKGLASQLVAIEVKSGAKLNLFSGEFYGDAAAMADSIAIKSSSAYGLNVQGGQFARWNAGFGGAIANNASIMIAGNYFINIANENALTNTANADISLMHPPVA